MIGDWKIRHLPRCTHHVFLSHCAEDRGRLVLPVYNALKDSQYSPWLDQHHYPRGRDPFAALREKIIHCRHVVYFVTAKFLAQGRGWNSTERAYSNLLQKNLHFRLELCISNSPYSLCLEVMRSYRDRHGNLLFNMGGFINRDEWTVGR